MTPQDFDKYFAEYIKESKSETEEIEDNVIESEEWQNLKEN